MKKVTGMPSPESDFYRMLGASIRRNREVAKLTQTELAAQAGVSRTTLTNMELGRQRMLVDQLASVASAINVSIIDLMPSAQNITAKLNQSEELPETVNRFLTKFSNREIE